MKSLAGVVAKHRKWLDRSLIAIAKWITILGVLIAIDATPDAVALGAHFDRLCYLYPAFDVNANVAVKLEYALVCNC